jgi:hypothetical protein
MQSEELVTNDVDFESSGSFDPVAIHIHNAITRDGFLQMNQYHSHKKVKTLTNLHNARILQIRFLSSELNKCHE